MHPTPARALVLVLLFSALCAATVCYCMLSYILLLNIFTTVCRSETPRTASENEVFIMNPDHAYPETALFRKYQLPA